VRASWDEVVELVAAAHVYTVKRWGPDRIAGFSPIPAMSPVSYASGARFLELIGAPMLSFYDWYADLPNASPQMFGDQTDVPESGDWWDAGYLIMWGSNVPMTRTPDAHWMTEARYRGQKVVAVAPDYAENVKFADEWVACRPGVDGALAMGMGHVLLKEFFADRQVEFFEDYNRRYTDLPFLVSLERTTTTSYTAGKFVVAGDLDVPEKDSENAMWKPVVLDARTDEVAVPNGSVGFRYGDEGLGKWNLDLGEIEPRSPCSALTRDTALVRFPRFDAPEGGLVAYETRGVPVRTIGGRVVTTVLDLLLAHYGVARDGLPGQWPTGMPMRRFPRPPPGPRRSPACLPSRSPAGPRVGAERHRHPGSRHDPHGCGHQPLVPLRPDLPGDVPAHDDHRLPGRNGGGWAHYVGQEKIRPIMGFQHLAFALDWHRPPRHMNQTAYWYVNTSQYRYDTFTADDLDAGTGVFAGKGVMDLLAQSVRLGWTPSYPTFNRSSLALADEAKAAGLEPAAYVVEQLRHGRTEVRGRRPGGAGEPPARPEPVALQPAGVQRQGQRVLPQAPARHRPRGHRRQAPPDQRPAGIEWPEDAAEAKLDLLTTIDFRMTSSTLFSDVVLPAATWYEKHDLSTTDMHPFVHSFSPAIDAAVGGPHRLGHLEGDRQEVLGARRRPPRHPHRRSSPSRCGTTPPRRWPRCTESSRTGAPERSSRCPARPLPVLAVAERDYPAIFQKMTSIGPLLEKVGMLTKGVPYDVKARDQDAAAPQRRGQARGPAPVSPRLKTDATWPMPSCTCRRRPTGTCRRTASRTSRSAPAQSCTTWPPSTRASRSPSPTPRSRRSRSSPHRSGRARSRADGATARSPSTSSGSSRSTR
jgi:nitrate reductase alpha subunit